MMPAVASCTRSLPTSATLELVAGRWPVSGPCWSTGSDATAPSDVSSGGLGGCAAAAPGPATPRRPRASTARPTANPLRFMRATSSAVGSPVELQLGLRVERGQFLRPGSGLRDEQAVEAAVQAVAVDVAVVAVGRPQALGVDRLERFEVVVGDLGGRGRVGEVDDGDPAAVPGGHEPVALVGLQHVEQVRRAVLLLGLHARDLERAERGAGGCAVAPDLALRAAAVALEDDLVTEDDDVGVPGEGGRVVELHVG